MYHNIYQVLNVNSLYSFAAITHIILVNLRWPVLLCTGNTDDRSHYDNHDNHRIPTLCNETSKQVQPARSHLESVRPSCNTAGLAPDKRRVHDTAPANRPAAPPGRLPDATTVQRERFLDVSAQTVRCALCSVGLFSHVCHKKPLLTKKHKFRCRQWVKVYGRWGLEK